jgi:DEAD/DEAH box helicase domain-containing protein
LQTLKGKNGALERSYLVLVDAVPGGTGFLKALYDETDGAGRAGEGIIDVLRRAKVALESCDCKDIQRRSGWVDPDGCYRCLRTYHQQYDANLISRTRGVRLLDRLLKAGERRSVIDSFETIASEGLIASDLERRFVQRLGEELAKDGASLERALVEGKPGYRFSLGGELWTLELQSLTKKADGILIGSQADFVLRSHRESVRPIAIFTDGYKYHVESVNRLADDVAKRRAIMESG